MIVKTKSEPRYKRRDLVFFLLGMMLFSTVVNVDAQKPQKARGLMRSISSTMPNGYTQVGNTDICYSKEVTNYNNRDYYSIDIQGKFESNYYGSTYDDHGYDVALQVGDNDATYLDCKNGSTVNGVQFVAEVIAQAELARICYYLTNTTENDLTISLGIHADVMIGDNDSAPIVRKIDTIGNTYGLALLDGNGAQLCVLFGAGLPGVTGVSDFWFGNWSSNSSPYEMVGNYNQGSNWMIENGSYDSGMGWCWKNRIIPAGETVVFSWLIGVGDVKLEPNSNFEVTPADPDGWNDLSRLHVLALEGDYESPAGLKGKIEYAVESSEEWIALTEMIESGSTFTGEVRAMFDPTLSKHTIRFRTVDQVGNTTLLPSIVYPDVAFYPLGGVSDKTYTGEEIFQTDLTCDLNSEQYVLKNYQNNVNVGTASFNIEGVFPHTIGRKNYTFKINPVSLTGDVTINEDDIVYNGQPHTPTWSFSEAGYAALVLDQDYTIEWSNNTLPGTATLTISGIGNYTNNIVKTFDISKAPLAEDLYQITLPDEDVSYDEASHRASVIVSEGVGIATITYQKDGTDLADAPSEPGSYDIFIEIAEGTLYLGLPKYKAGSFTIYQFDEAEWQTLQAIREQLVEQGWEQPWDMTQGAKTASSLNGLTIEQGHVVGLDLSNLRLAGSFPTSILLLPSLKSLDISGNKLTGNIGEALSETSYPNLTLLNASYNQFSDVNPVLPMTITTLDLKNQAIGIVLENNTGAIAIDKVPSILLYNHTGQTLHTEKSVHLSNYPPIVAETAYTEDNPYWGAVINNWGTPYPELSSLTANNTYYGLSGDILYLTYPLASSEVANSYCLLKYTFSNGDVNMDSFVNVLDLQATINYIFENYNTRPYNFTAANLWNDGQINIQDVIRLVDLLMNSETENGGQTAGARRNAVVNSTVYVQNNQLMINSNEPIAAFDITISGSNNLNIASSLEQIGMIINTKVQLEGMRIIGYSMDGACIPAGKFILGTFDKAACIRAAMLSDKDANVIRTSYTNTTSINSVESPDLTPSNIYDLQGRKVNEMSRKGIYIKNGDKVVK